MIYIVALGVGFKCPRKIHLNTQWGGGVKNCEKIEDGSDIDRYIKNVMTWGGGVNNSEKSANVLYGRPLGVLRIGGILSLSFD